MSNETCSNCKFSHELEGGWWENGYGKFVSKYHRTTYLICRKSPSQYDVGGEDWCGEWKEGKSSCTCNCHNADVK